jgi:hypothetical protein
VRTYRTPRETAIQQKLSFLEWAYVAEVKGRHYRLVRDPNLSLDRRFSPEAEDLGWVHERFLLLWGRALRTCNGGRLEKKALIVNTVKAARDISLLRLTQNSVQFYRHPNRQAEAANGQQAQLFQFFFIYKREGNSVLLGLRPGISYSPISLEREVADNLLGWVDSDRLVDWDHRIAVEPNAQQPACELRKQQAKSKASVFVGKGAAQQYLSSGQADPTQLLWNNDTYCERPIPDWRRFPVLDGKYAEPVLKVGLMGEVKSSQGSLNQEEIADIRNRLSRVQRSIRNLDMVFVIDATRSMEVHFQAIRLAIIAFQQKLEADTRFQNIRFRFGAVGFRDEKDGRDLVEVHRLGTIESFLNFLRNLKARSAANDDIPEAVNYGLNQAFISTGMVQDHNNVIILVGDVGNHRRSDRSQVSGQTIVKQMVKFHANLLAFQVDHPAQPADRYAYESFVSDLRLIIENSVAANYRNKITQSPFLKSNWREPILSQEGNFWLSKGDLTGLVYDCPAGESLPPNTLGRYLEELLLEYVDGSEYLVEVLNKGIDQGQDIDELLERRIPSASSRYTSPFRESVYRYLEEVGVQPERVQLLKGEAFQLFTEAYAANGSAGAPLFSPVLLVSKLEFGRLVASLKKLTAQSNTNEELRLNLINTWKELLKNSVGDLPDAEIEDMTFKELTEKVYGLPATNNLLDRRLKELANKRKVSDAELNFYVNQIATKYNQLYRIFNENTGKYAFLSNDISYYWIDQSLLP